MIMELVSPSEPLSAETKADAASRIGSLLTNLTNRWRIIRDESTRVHPYLKSRSGW